MKKQITVPASRREIWGCLIVTGLSATLLFALVVGLFLPGKLTAGYLGAIAGFLVLTTVGGSATVLFIWRNAQFIIQKDRVQMKYRSGKIAGQIPFDNMKWIDVVEEVEQFRDQLGDYEKKYDVMLIKLCRGDDPDTWWPGQDKKRIRIKDLFNKDLRWILNKISDRVKAYEKKSSVKASVVEEGED